MKNDFYNEFDVELQERRNPDYRTPFQQDHDRIIYTSAFRRLQAKTQVFSVGEYDFYRNRLTHSIEVAQIGRSICNFLFEHDPHLHQKFHVDVDLVEAVCLAHDLGHPPFGHAGERALHEVMRLFGGFEGNAQTLRMMTETIFSRRGKRTGIRPTRALLDGVMKYKSLYGELDQPKNHFLYDDQLKHVSFIFGGISIPDSIRSEGTLNQFRSLECQIMDWADDTAYSLNDLTDGIRAGFLTTRGMDAWASEQSLDGEEAEVITRLLETVQNDDIEIWTSSLIGDFIRACSLASRTNFMSDRTNRYAYELRIDPDVRKQANLFSRLSRDLVFQSARLQQLEFKGRMMLHKLFESYQEVYLCNQGEGVSLLPNHREQLIREAEGQGSKARLLCDYIAGMTDGFAVRTYKRLFEPDFGSIVDIV